MAGLQKKGSANSVKWGGSGAGAPGILVVTNASVKVGNEIIPVMTTDGIIDGAFGIPTFIEAMCEGYAGVGAAAPSGATTMVINGFDCITEGAELIWSQKNVGRYRFNGKAIPA